ncbi:NAD-glutamate dehydrogenase [Kiloniella sp. b19]|uniref:NAD-glutamate dehydrogenase n=1 Tax=Kiloniella sp. GXU_MW_B19 TaxID=3141326 RepID=UPI0031D965C6
MSKSSKQSIADLISRINEHALKKLPKDKTAQVQDFIEQFFSNVPLDDIEDESTENLFGAAMSAWESIQCKKEGAHLVEVFNPRPNVHGWKSSHTVIEILNDDMPFLVDSLTSALQRMEKETLLIVHPVIHVERDKKGKLIKLLPVDKAETAGSRHESLMQILITEQTEEQREAVKADLNKVFQDVRDAVDDWKIMQKRLENCIADIRKSPPPLDKNQVEESLAFLEWLDNDNFTFLGVREYSFEGEGQDSILKIKDGSMGVLKDHSIHVFDGLRSFGRLPQDVRAFMIQPSLLRITKANRRSNVHRATHMDTIAIKRFDKKGNVVGETLFAGLFTSSAYARSPLDIPLLRQKVTSTINRANFRHSSHDGKALSHTLETFPRDELFQINEDELFETAMRILHLQERRRIALFVRKDPFERFASCLVYIPRDRFDTALRRKIGQMICNAYNGTVSAFFTHLADTPLARVHFIIKTKRGEVPDVDVAELEKQVAEAGRSWEDKLREALIEERGEEQGILAMTEMGYAFPLSYQEDFNEHEAVSDLTKAEEALRGDGLAMNLYRPLGGETNELRFKIYLRNTAVPLSDVLPMLENMGLKVLSENPYHFKTPEHRKNAGKEDSVWMHDFEMVTSDDQEVDIYKVRDAFHAAFAAIWHRKMENDGFNKLVLSSALTVREVTVVRAYCKYLLQARIPFSQSYMEQTLARNPKVTSLLLQLFTTRFLAEGQKEDHPAQQDIVDAINVELEQVSNLDEDRIIRRFRNVIVNTLRTNVEQLDENGDPKSYLSFKIESGKITDLPLPRPYREIFVYSPEIEGVHLRFGPVARGGLRWSDRREDFRTEILGLVKAQQVKNSVIVPVGSKGGFVVKNPPPASAGREAFQDKGIACYKTFIRGLLDLTDNLSGGDVVPPQNVIRHDDDDPYLVVAADKGTATFSDIANGVSADYGFWLDDAFASGGSAGYDHKGMAITARGAWESVKRHFRELGKDIQNEDFTVMGVGDMAGDVFGNGMLLSRHIRLQAAFNHMHIFVDPDPDSAKTWKERKRLFDLPRSSWMDYDQSLISKGGGIFERAAKSIPISPEMKKVFGIKEDELPPNQLIRAILKSQVELLWFGGIGTYIKSTSETNADAGDRANDALRLNANELTCKVVGEGANLGMTQLARVEFGRHSGKINTDFLDNSAGVDCSDHEVNIKILLGAVEGNGDMTRKQRDKLLADMTDEVADLVLRDNYLQSQAISVTAAIGGRLLDRTARYMRALEKQGLLNREIEFLPDDEQILERMKQGLGLERAELATMLSYAKISLYDELLQSNLPDDPAMEQELVNYFPTPLRKKYAGEIAQHRLRREIIATAITNDMINRVGITFVHEVREKTGFNPAEIARAYRVTQEVFDITSIFRAIESLDNKVPATVQASMLADCGRLIEQSTVWFLRNANHPISIQDEGKRFVKPVASLTSNLEGLLSKDNKTQMNQRIKALMKDGVPEDLAKRIAGLGALASAGDIACIAEACKLSVEEAGSTYFNIGALYGFDWLRKAAQALPSESAWDKLAVTAMIDDLFGHQADLTERVLQSAEKLGKVDKAIEDWAASRQALVKRTEQILAELSAAGQPDYAMLAVANRQLKNMVTV